MTVNITKLISYKPLSKSKKGKALLQEMSLQLGIPTDKLMRAFSLFLAVLIKRHTRNAVKTQKIAGKPMRTVYKPLSASYNNKKPKSTQDKFWINTDFLIKEMKVWQNKNGDVFVGYRSNAVHKGVPFKTGKKRVKASMVMVYLERGTNNIPPRPLFSVIVRNIAKNISFYFEMFLRQLKEGKIKL